jgi:quinol monooxygenase YgiN
MVELLVRLTATSGQSEQLIQALRSVMRDTYLEGVCQAAHAASDVDDPDIVWDCEDWANIEGFERHVRSESFDRLLAIIETTAKAPLIECRVVSETRGAEYLAAVRASR